MTPWFEMLGIMGVGLSVVAYLPQVTHLVKEHCSDGISLPSWEMWLVSGLLVGALALYRQDYVFIILAATTTVSSAAILYLARRYQGQSCAPHEEGQTQTPDVTEMHST